MADHRLVPRPLRLGLLLAGRAPSTPKYQAQHGTTQHSHWVRVAPDKASYWFLMQVGMAIGVASSYPMNVLLIRKGIKEAM